MMYPSSRAPPRLRLHGHTQSSPAIMKGPSGKPTAAWRKIVKETRGKPTTVWQTFFANYVRVVHLSKEELQPYSGILAIDIEGPIDETVREIGIAFLPIEFLRIKPDFSDTSLASFRISHQVEVHTLQIQGRRTAKKHYYETFHHDEPKLIDCKDVENSILQILESTKNAHNNHFLLVGFDLRREFSF